MKTKLSHDIDDYIQNHRPNLEKEREYYYSELTLVEAIEKSAKGIDSNGKFRRHQFRNGKLKCQKGYAELMKYFRLIQKCESFEEIFQITEVVTVNIKGLRNLWSYDTALYISFNKGYAPKEVYVQRGVRDGVKKIFPAHHQIQHCRSLPRKIFPKELHKLKPYEVENFLCIWGAGKL